MNVSTERAVSTSAAGRQRHAWLIAAIVVAGLLLRVKDFTHDVDGREHLFRQTHVAANIHFLVEDGFSVLTRHFTEDPLMPSLMGPLPHDYWIFDGPLYQNVAAAIVRGTGWPIVPVARAINMAAYCVSCVALVLLLRDLRVRKTAVAWTLLFYATSPLRMFYDRAVIPDPFAAAFALIGVFAYVHWSTVHRSWRWYLVAVLALNAAAFIKSPLALPATIAVAGHAYAGGRWRNYPFLLLLGTIGVGVVGFKLYANWVNVGTFQTPAWESRWYFGTLGQRVDLGTLGPFMARLVRQLVTAGGMMAAGIALLRARAIPALVLYWCAGVVVTLVLFFPLNVIHNYYQIGFVAPLALLAGLGVDRVVAMARPPWRPVAATVAALIVVGTAYVNRLPRIEPVQLIQTGHWVQSLVPPDGYVMYVGELDCCKELAYYARRRGLPVQPEMLGAKLPCSNGAPLFVSASDQNSSSVREILRSMSAQEVGQRRGLTIWRVFPSAVCAHAPGSG